MKNLGHFILPVPDELSIRSGSTETTAPGRAETAVVAKDKQPARPCLVDPGTTSAVTTNRDSAAAAAAAGGGAIGNRLGDQMNVEAVVVHLMGHLLKGKEDGVRNKSIFGVSQCVDVNVLALQLNDFALQTKIGLRFTLVSSGICRRGDSAGKEEAQQGGDEGGDGGEFHVSMAVELD